VGALHGVFSLVFSRLSPEGRALALDPSPLAFSKLLYNVHANSWSRIDTVEAALSDRTGFIDMAFEWEHAIAQAPGSAAPSEIRALCQTGDLICAERGFQPDLIKIDVEGHEVKVLRGLRETLAANRPAVFIEIHPSRIAIEGDLLEELIQIFSSLGCTATDTEGSPVELPGINALVQDFRLIFKHPQSRESLAHVT